MQQLQPFRRYLDTQLGHARDVTARSAKFGDEAELDRVAADLEDNRNGRGCRLCRKRRQVVVAALPSPDDAPIGGHRRQPVMLALRPAIFDCDVTAMM